MTILLNIKNLNKIFLISLLLIFCFFLLNFLYPLDYFNSLNDSIINEPSLDNKFIEGCIYL